MRRWLSAVLIVALFASPAFAINDKLLHAGAGLAIQAVFQDPNEGFLAAAVAGAAKEFWDAEFDPWDFAATLGGALVGRVWRTGRFTITDSEFRAGYWIASGVSLAGMCNQQKQGYYEINPVVTAVWGEHPSFWEGAALNVLWGIGAELAYRVNPTLARWMWGGGTAVALYWMDYDGRHGVPGASSTWRISWTWEVGRDYGKASQGDGDTGENPVVGMDRPARKLAGIGGSVLGGD